MQPKDQQQPLHLWLHVNRVLLSLVWLLLFCGVPASALAREPVTIYFHNPEASLVRNEVLKNTFDSYLASHGAFHFQPVVQRAAFESLIKQQAHALYVMPSWYFEQLRRQFPGIHARLVGQKGAQEVYQKVLVASHAIPAETQTIIALAGTEEHGHKILKDMLTREQLARVRILVVPKDIDALMSLGFGLADAALSSEHSLESFAKVNTSVANDLKVLAKSAPIRQILVATPDASDPQIERATRALLVMPQSEYGRRSLSLLGLDAWQESKQLEDREATQ
ncbi:MAG: PhnD/SsuA/transferrin family substrate-binding protein [Oleiphilaceae bacterium]|nr:PhnD/SsuA/transferrin family substrate-binding protein [Oleiphilaceae bacterium]